MLFIHSFIYLFFSLIKEFPRAIIEKKKVFEKLAALNSRFSSPFFFFFLHFSFAIQKLLINGDFEKNNEAIHLFSLSHVGKSNEN